MRETNLFQIFTSRMNREGKSKKHLRDIASMIEISSDRINFVELENKIKGYGLEEEWAKAQKMVNSSNL
ncbi:MAG: hypothetical protein IMF20_01120 [Proteobacteria bacterium]|nr:hypothetical protein [Pseudomonadota bacterium]